MMTWTMLHPSMRPHDLGELPYFLNEDDPRPAREQFHSNYKHGGGWRPFKGHTLTKNHMLAYPGDPSLPPLASVQFRDELIIVHPHSWVTIVQPDGTYETCRMD